MNVDFESKNEMIALLTWDGFTNIQDTDDKYKNPRVSWDFEADRDGKHYMFELKARRIPSTKYGDNFVEKIKYTKMAQRVASGKVAAGYIISTYTDGIVHVSRWNDDFVEDYRWCNECTDFASKGKVRKLCAIYPAPKKYKKTLIHIDED